MEKYEIIIHNSPIYLASWDAVLGLRWALSTDNGSKAISTGILTSRFAEKCKYQMPVNAYIL